MPLSPRRDEKTGEAQPSPETPATMSRADVYEWAPVSSANHTAANPPNNPPSQGKEGR
jgi:hypothetical protein